MLDLSTGLLATFAAAVMSGNRNYDFLVMLTPCSYRTPGLALPGPAPSAGLPRHVAPPAAKKDAVWLLKRLPKMALQHVPTHVAGSGQGLRPRWLMVSRRVRPGTKQGQWGGHRRGLHWAQGVWCLANILYVIFPRSSYC